MDQVQQRRSALFTPDPYHPPSGIPWALNDSSRFSSLKRGRAGWPSHINFFAKRQRPEPPKRVQFASDDKVHHYDPLNGFGETHHHDDDCSEDELSYHSRSKLTDELTILSTLHGRARRELRDINKHDLQAAVKYGVKTPGRTVNGEKRWRFEFGNTIFITDEHCTKEITCYKKAIKIEPAKITEVMWGTHWKAAQILKDDPHLVSTLKLLLSLLSRPDQCVNSR